jgi:hypothetical protein
VLGIGITVEAYLGVSKTTIDQNRTTKTDSLPLTHFIKHLKCETKKITMRAQRALEKLESFDPMTPKTGFHIDQRKQS